jgi:hypothetical protein
MMKWWGENDVPGPILLANRDNCIILNNAVNNSTTSAEVLACSAPTCGGVKAAEITGAIFHHKDDKKGQGNTFTWFEHEGIPLNFPNTSTVCYGSYCEAAGVLIEYCDAFIQFLEYV